MSHANPPPQFVVVWRATSLRTLSNDKATVQPRKRRFLHGSRNRHAGEGARVLLSMPLSRLWAARVTISPGCAHPAPGWNAPPLTSTGVNVGDRPQLAGRLDRRDPVSQVLVRHPSPSPPDQTSRRLLNGQPMNQITAAVGLRSLKKVTINRLFADHGSSRGERFERRQRAKAARGQLSLA